MITKALYVTPAKLYQEIGFFLEEVEKLAKLSTNRLALDQKKIPHTADIGARSHSNLTFDFIQKKLASTFEENPNVYLVTLGALNLFVVTYPNVNYVVKHCKITGRRFPKPTTAQKKSLSTNQLYLGLNKPTLTVWVGHSMDPSRSYHTGTEILVRDDDGSVLIKQSLDSIRTGKVGQLDFVDASDSAKIPETKVVGKFDSGTGHNSAMGAQ